MTHCLKTLPQFYKAVLFGGKTFEVRKDDRGFKINDCLVLQEFDPEKKAFTGLEYQVRVKYITEFMQQEGYVVMAIEPWSRTGTN